MTMTKCDKKKFRGKNKRLNSHMLGEFIYGIKLIKTLLLSCIFDRLCLHNNNKQK